MPAIELEDVAMIDVSDEALEASAGKTFTVGSYGRGCEGNTF
jgi:hypothetical protein